jgi:excisionase family DNA binding protein
MREKEKYMNVPAVSKYLHVAKSTIYHWVYEKRIPHVKLGTKTLFVTEQIDQWVLENSRLPESIELPDLSNFN